MFACIYTTRSKTGDPLNQWAENVFLTDHFEIFENQKEATKRFEKLWEQEEVHSAAVAQIVEATEPHWIE